MQLRCVCYDTLPWLISVSSGPMSRRAFAASLVGLSLVLPHVVAAQDTSTVQGFEAAFRHANASKDFRRVEQLVWWEHTKPETGEDMRMGTGYLPAAEPKPQTHSLFHSLVSYRSRSIRHTDHGHVLHARQKRQSVLFSCLRSATCHDNALRMKPGPNQTFARWNPGLRHSHNSNQPC